LSIQTLVFAVLHIGRGLDGSIFVLGFLLGLAYLRTGSLLIPLLIHMAWNAQFFMATYSHYQLVERAQVYSFPVAKLSIFSLLFIVPSIKNIRNLVLRLSRNYQQRRTASVGK
jgi:membrane protease YdiL (CAAX protease family)